MRFNAPLLLSLLPLLALAKKDEDTLVDPEDGAVLDVTTVTQTSTHFVSTVTATGKPTETAEASDSEEEDEVKVLYTVTQVPPALLIAQNATAAPEEGKKPKETGTAGNFTLTPEATTATEEEGAEETKKPGESAAGRREIVWGVLVGGLVGASIMGF